MHDKMYEKAEEIVAVIKNETDWNKIEKYLRQLQELAVLSPTLELRKEKSGKHSLAGLNFTDGKKLAEVLEKYWVNQVMKDNCW